MLRTGIVDIVFVVSRSIGTSNNRGAFEYGTIMNNILLQTRVAVGVRILGIVIH